MKKEFMFPEVEIVRLQEGDVISTSGNCTAVDATVEVPAP